MGVVSRGLPTEEDGEGMILLNLLPSLPDFPIFGVCES